MQASSRYGRGMSKNIEAFFVKAASDPALEEKLKAASSLEAILAIAKEEGFAFDAAEISDQELEAVAGGSNRSSLEQTKLMDLMQKYNQTQELQSSLVKKFQEMTSTIIRNIG